MGAGVNFDYALILRYVPNILAGLSVTIVMWFVGTLCAVVLGFCVATARRFGPNSANFSLGALVELIRGTPFLIQLFLLYFGGPYIGLFLDPIPAGLLGLTVYGAAYFSEIFRAGFESVPVGHIEAAECVGLNRVQIVKRILLPEMTMLVLPSAVNMAILLIKETAVLSIITVPELTMIVSAIGSEYYAFVESLFLLALLYWVLVEFCGYLGRKAEAKLSYLRLSAS